MPSSRRHINRFICFLIDRFSHMFLSFLILITWRHYKVSRTFFFLFHHSQHPLAHSHALSIRHPQSIHWYGHTNIKGIFIAFPLFCFFLYSISSSFIIIFVLFTRSKRYDTIYRKPPIQIAQLTVKMIWKKPATLRKLKETIETIKSLLTSTFWSCTLPKYFNTYAICAGDARFISYKYRDLEQVSFKNSNLFLYFFFFSCLVKIDDEAL